MLNNHGVCARRSEQGITWLTLPSSKAPSTSSLPASRAPGQTALPFQVFDGQKLLPISAYLARHPRPDLLQLENRMKWLSAGPYGHRAGDVLLLARSGLERPVEERFYFSHPYRLVILRPLRREFGSLTVEGQVIPYGRSPGGIFPE